MINERLSRDTGKGGFLYWVAKVPEIVCLSLVWLVSCLPVITVIPASTALYDAVVNCTLGDDIGPFRRFFAAFKNSLLRGIPMSLLWGVVIFLYVNTYLFTLAYAEQSQVMLVLSLVYIAVGILPLGALSWVVPLFAEYDYRFWELQRTALSVMTLRMPMTLVMEAIFIAGVVACLSVPYLLLVIPALIPAAQSFVVKRVFGQIFEEDEEEK